MSDVDPHASFYTIGIIPGLNFRFVLARDRQVATEVATLQGASPQVSSLLGECLLGAFLLASHATKDLIETVSLHLEFSGPPRRVIAFARAAGALRATVAEPGARWDGFAWTEAENAILRVNRWHRDRGRPLYSSTVPLREVPLARNLEDYLGRSDQIQSFIRIDASAPPDGSGSELFAYMFQALPGATADQVDEALELIDGRNAPELVREMLDGAGEQRQVPGTEHHFHSVQMLRSGSFFAYCDCSAGRVQQVLYLMGRREVDRIMAEHGRIHVECEFCRRAYDFFPNDVELIFDDTGPAGR